VIKLTTLPQDVRHAFRLMRRDPAFTVTAIATLALGIGFTTAIFSVAYGVLWRPLPYPNPERLVVISSAQETVAGIKAFGTWPPTTYEGLRTRAITVEGLAAYASINAELTGRGEPAQVPAVSVSPNFFTVLGVSPARGRAFLTDQAAPNDDRSVMVSDRFWRTYLGADPAVVGQLITLDGVARTVIGVMPPAFSFRPLIRGAALPAADIFLANRWSNDPGTSASLSMLGRMKPDTTPERVEAELASLLSDSSLIPAGVVAQAGTFSSSARTFARTAGLQEYGTESVRTLLLILVGAVTFVLLIACVNVANLQLARLTARRGELSVRMALGAGRGRIVRQLVTEALVLSTLGALFGVLFAMIAIEVTVPLVPQAILPRLGSIAIDRRVLAFSLGLSLLSTLVIGLVPALRMSGTSFGEGLAPNAGGTRTTGDGQGERLRTLMVAAQIAMTLVLLIGAGLLIRSFVQLTSVSPGFESSGRDGIVQTVRVTLPERLYDTPERMQAFARGVLDRIKFLPGVKSASVINSAPFGMMFIQGAFEIESQPEPTISAGTPKIDAGYFKTMGIPLLAGREFTERDTANAPKVAIISERIAREYFPGGATSALGRRLRLGIMSADGEWLTIVGVVADIRQQGLDQDVKPMIYAPFQQERAAPFLLRFVSFVARTDTPASVLDGIRAEIRRAAPEVPIAGTTTMDEALAASVAAPRFRTVMLGVFATAATLIATCGLYGLMAYAVTERRREIGVRMALGATRRDVLRLILTRALRIVIAGLVVGLAGAAGVTRVLHTFLFGVTPTDPIVFASVPLLLLAVGLAAAWLPARRATRIDPWATLRAE
jgi:putative ABC transport system permease protein